MAEIKLNENIRALRKEKGIGQEALANALGVTVQAVSKWETAGSMPDITLLPELAKFFGVTIEELFYGKAEELQPNTKPQESKTNVLTVEPAEIKEEAKEEPSDNFAQDTASEKQQESAYESQSHSYTWDDLSDLGRTLSDHVKKITEGVRESVKDNISNLNLHFNSHDRWTEENKVCSDLPNDQVLRVVQFCGNEIVRADEVISDRPIHLEIVQPEHEVQNYIRQITIYGSVEITGMVGGSVSADGGVRCGNVGGSVLADGDVDCQSVGGNVTSDGNVNCGIVNGRITADGDVTCGNVMGSVTAEGDVSCGSVNGSVRCEGNVAFRN